ncbi:MAG: hypothetical protein E7522_06330 [Ruminococcaceae bacterium]|nr:hypothetical protein [Oscillospiraceae bacterium]
MTNYRETSAYDLSLFEPQVVEPRRVREAQPVKRQAVKKQTKKPVKKTHTKTVTKTPAKKQGIDYTRQANNTVKKVANTVDQYQHTVARNTQKAAVSLGLKKAMCCLAVLFAFTVVNLYMNAECDKLDSQIANLQNEVSIAEGETVRLNAELNSMVDTEKVIEYAETKLGMVKAESYQITYINLSQGDEFVVAGDKEVSQDSGLKTEIKELFAYIF